MIVEDDHILGHESAGIVVAVHDNVKSLKTAWVFQAGVIGLQAAPATYSLEAAPIVVDGQIYGAEVTPLQVGVRIRQHPAMAVVAPQKARFAKHCVRACRAARSSAHCALSRKPPASRCRWILNAQAN